MHWASQNTHLPLQSYRTLYKLVVRSDGGLNLFPQQASRSMNSVNSSVRQGYWSPTGVRFGPIWSRFSPALCRRQHCLSRQHQRGIPSTDAAIGKYTVLLTYLSLRHNSRGGEEWWEDRSVNLSSPLRTRAVLSAGSPGGFLPCPVLFVKTDFRTSRILIPPHCFFSFSKRPCEGSRRLCHRWDVPTQVRCGHRSTCSRQRRVITKEV